MIRGLDLPHKVQIIGGKMNIDPNESIKRLRPIVHFLRTYHRHEVVGLENIPSAGSALLVFNHSLATYDISLLFGAIWDKFHRVPRPLADRLFYRIPFLGELVDSTGAIEGTHENAKTLLEQGEMVAVAPGGMREALRPSSERYQILWERRKGFVKLALETQTPIILAVCPKADDIYDVYPSTLTAFAYRHFKIPLFLARGLGPTPIPRPVKLIHFVSEPILPPQPKKDPRARAQQVNQLHKKVIKHTQMLIGEAIAYRDS